MLKLFKTVIRPNEGAETYERDSKHKITMGYDNQTKTIKVKVEEVIAPNPNLSEDLPEDTPTVLREPHTTSDFIVVAEREFTESDFIMRTDNNKWIVEYDSKTKKISDPISVYELSKQYINGSNSHEQIYYNLNEYRYQNDPSVTPCFVLDCFFKSLGFDGSTVQFFVENLDVDLLDSVLEIPAEQLTEVTPKEYEFWNNYHVRVMVAFEILDSEGKVVASAFPTVKQSAKATGFKSLTAVSPVDTSGMPAYLNIPPATSWSGNRYYVQLPDSAQYTVRVMFGSRIHNIINSRPYATFDITCINGVTSKNRITNEYDPANPNPFVQEFIANHNHPADKMAIGFGGAEGLVVQTIGHLPGDFFKMKLNIGEFTSWGELWVEVV